MLSQAEADPRNVPTVAWLVAEPEAGELEGPNLVDPRLSAAPPAAPAPTTAVLPCPLFPFLPGPRDMPDTLCGELPRSLANSMLAVVVVLLFPQQQYFHPCCSLSSPD